jgi:polyene glycosyltransferase
MATPTGPILFASIAHAGQINPLLAIVAELSRRGVCPLWFASTEDRRAHVEATVASSPVTFAPFGLADPTKTFIENPRLYAAGTRGPRTTGAFLAAVRWMLDPQRTALEYRRLLAHIDQIQPSLMVIDVGTVSALDAAMTRRIPFILSVPCTPSALFIGQLGWDYPCPGSGLPRRMNLGQKLANLGFTFRLGTALMTRSPLVSFALRRKALGIANPLGSGRRYGNAAAAVFCYSVFGLEYPFPAPGHLHLLGAMVSPSWSVASGNKEGLSPWLDRHPSVIYVGLGTLVRLSRAQVAALVSAFGRLGPSHQVLWKLPSPQQALLPARTVLPSNVRIEPWVASQLEVLAHPHVRAFVTHGGGNGFHEGIYFGKPLLVLPFWLDCYDFAVRAVDSGVGLTLDRPPAFTAEEVVAKLRRLLAEDTFQGRAQYWGTQLRKAGGVSRAADLIVELACAAVGACGQ